VVLKFENEEQAGGVLAAARKLGEAAGGGAEIVKSPGPRARGAGRLGEARRVAVLLFENSCRGKFIAGLKFIGQHELGSISALHSFHDSSHTNNLMLHVFNRPADPIFVCVAVYFEIKDYIVTTPKSSYTRAV
jgi:hypothetical protein